MSLSSQLNDLVVQVAALEGALATATATHTTDAATITALTSQLTAAQAEVARLTAIIVGTPPPPTPTPPPTTRKFMLGVHSGNDNGNPTDSLAGGAQDAVRAYAKWTGRPNSVQIFRQFATPDSIGGGAFWWGGSWVEAMLRRWGKLVAEVPGSMMMMPISPGFSKLHGQDPASGYQSVVNGNEDGAIKAMVTLSLKYGLTNTIWCPYHESYGYDGNPKVGWYSWPYEPVADLHKAAMIRIKSKVKEYGGVNMRVAWAGGFTWNAKAMAAYPGPAGCDLICPDPYWTSSNLGSLLNELKATSDICARDKLQWLTGEQGPWNTHDCPDAAAKAGLEAMWAFMLTDLYCIAEVPFNMNVDADHQHRLEQPGSLYNGTSARKLELVKASIPA